MPFPGAQTLVRILQTYAGVPAKEALQLQTQLDEVGVFATQVALEVADLDAGVMAYAEDTALHFLRQDSSWNEIATGAGGTPDPLLLGDGAVDAPTYSFTSDEDTGIYLIGEGILGVTTAGVEAMRWGDGVALLQDGAAGAPGLGFANDPDTGLYRVGDNQIAMVAGGDYQWQIIDSQAIWRSAGAIVGRFTPSSFLSENINGLQLLFGASSANIPNILPNRSDPNTGIGWASADSLSLITAGIEAIRIDSTQNVGFGVSVPLAKLHAKTAGALTESMIENSSGSFVVQMNSTTALLQNKTTGTTRFVAGTGATQAELRMLPGGSGWVALLTNGIERWRIDTAKLNIGVSPTAGTDPLKATLADFFDYISKDIVVAVGGSAVASVDLGFDLPAGAMMIGAALNIQTAITGATGATAIGLGISGTEDKYGETSTLTLDSKATESIGGMVALAASEDLKIYATDGAGTPTGTIQNGSVRVRLVYAIMTALPNA